MKDRGQSAHRANTVGHSRSNMQHEIGGCLKGIGSSPFGCVCCVSSNPCGFGDAAALRSVLSLTALALILTDVFLLCQTSFRPFSCCSLND